MRVLIFEPNFKGHFYAYLSLIAPAVRATGASLTLALSKEGASSKEFQTLLAPLLNADPAIEVDTHMPSEAGPGLRGALRRTRRLRDAIRRTRAQHVLVPYADHMTTGLFLRRLWGDRPAPRDVPVEALYLAAGLADANQSLRQRMTRALNFQAALRQPYTRTYHLDPRIYERVARTRFAEHSGLMPDPVETPPPLPKLEARAQIGVPTDGRLIGCAGVIDRRKGCDLLIRAFAAAKLAPSDRLLLIGPHEAEVRQMLAGEHAPLVSRGRIVSIDRFVHPAELAAGLRAMDLVCTPYPNHAGSASIIIRAAAAGRPVLGAHIGWIAHTVPRFGLGWTCDVLNQASFVPALERAILGCESWRPSAAADRFVRFHSTTNFTRTWCAWIRDRMGLAPEPTDSWGWVLEALDTPRDAPARTGPPPPS